MPLSQLTNTYCNKYRVITLTKYQIIPCTTRRQLSKFLDNQYLTFPNKHEDSQSLTCNTRHPIESKLCHNNKKFKFRRLHLLPKYNRFNTLVLTMNRLKNKLTTFGHLSLENLELRANNKRQISNI